MKINIGITTGLELIVRMIRGTSERDEWLILHMMRQLVMLPLMAKFMTHRVKQFIVSNVYDSLNIFSISTDWLENTSFMKDLSFSQFNEYFKMLKWHSGSTLVRNILLIVFIFTIALLHLLIWLLR